MADSDTEPGHPRWLVEPPAPGEVQVHVAIGEGAELTPEVRAALEALTELLFGDDVRGHAFGASTPECPDLSSCTNFLCSPLNSCQRLSRLPCAADVICVITKATSGL